MENMTAIGTSAAERPAFKAGEFVVRAVLAIGWTGWGIICANVPGAGSIAPALAVLSYALFND